MSFSGLDGGRGADYVDPITCTADRRAVPRLAHFQISQQILRNLAKATRQHSFGHMLVCCSRRRKFAMGGVWTCDDVRLSAVTVYPIHHRV